LGHSKPTATTTRNALKRITGVLVLPVVPTRFFS
jgi:hypothetical protein